MLSEYEVAADGLVVIYLMDDMGKDLGHAHDSYFRVVFQLRVRDGVGDEHFLQHGVVNPALCIPGKDTVRGAGPDAERSFVHKYFCSFT